MSNAGSTTTAEVGIGPGPRTVLEQHIPCRHTQPQTFFQLRLLSTSSDSRMVAEQPI